MRLNFPLGATIGGVFLFAVCWVLFGYLRHPHPGSNRLSLAPLGLVFIAGAASILTAVLTISFGMNQVVIASACALGIALALIHPVCGITLLVAVLLLRPWEFVPYNPSLAILPKLFSLLSVLSWIIYRTRRGDLSFHWSHLASVLTAYLSWTLVSSICAGGGMESVSLFFERFYPVLFVWFAMLHSVTNSEDFEVLLRGTTLALLGVITNSILYTASAGGFSALYGRLQGIGYFGNSNDLAALAVIALPLALFPPNSAQSWKFIRASVRVLFASMVLVAIWWSKSRGALLAIGIMAMVSVITRIRGTAIRFTLAGACLLVAFIAMQLIKRNEEDLSLSQQSRWNFVIAGFRMAKAHPIFGVGMGNYEGQYEAYTPQLIEFGARSAHSSWVVPLAEGSVLGLVLFLWFIGFGLVLAKKVSRQYSALFIAYTGYLVVMSFLSHTYLILPYLLVALVAAASRTIKVTKSDRQKIIPYEA